MTIPNGCHLKLADIPQDLPEPANPRRQHRARNEQLRQDLRQAHTEFVDQFRRFSLPSFFLGAAFGAGAGLAFRSLMPLTEFLVAILTNYALANPSAEEPRLASQPPQLDAAPRQLARTFTVVHRPY